ncbi:MAG: hypothetical protein AB8B97_00940 [Granulosicoccus sp.]
MSRVLLLTPSTFGYETRITEAVKHSGHDVRWHDERVGNSLLLKVLTRLRLIRYVPGIVSAHVQRILKAADDLKAEVVFIVNPETLKGPDYQLIRKALPEARIVIYKWDSIRQKPLDEETFQWVDDIYSFDPEDCQQDSRLMHWPLFHCHQTDIINQDASGRDYKYDFAFVGSAHLRRIKLLATFEKTLKAEQRPYFFLLVSPSPIHHVLFLFARRWFGYSGTLTLQQLAYPDYLTVIEQSRCILDVEFQRQSGLTMRTVEVIFSGTPLMTTNPSLKGYEFYDRERMFFMDEHKIDVPRQTPTEQQIDLTLFEKHSITNWASVIIDGAKGLTWNGSQWT